MNYRELCERLFALRRFGMRPGLDGISELCAALDHPEERLRVVHVGGTNGKGSTAAMIASVLQAQGVRVGLYTSPHLLRMTERIRVDGVEIDPDVAAELGARVLSVAVDGGGEHTFFEIVTAMALLHFVAAPVDVAVLEVGLGGRLDATNLVPRPLATVVT